MARTVFFLSDQTGVTAETLGRSMLAQFADLDYHPVTLPFVSTPDAARDAVARIQATGLVDGVRPIVFSTLAQAELREVVQAADALCLDFFAAFLTPVSRELGMEVSRTPAKAHGIVDKGAYTHRIEATHYALANADGGATRDYDRADLILVGVSRCGKTPTCLYLALQYGIFAANYPLADEEFESGRLPQALVKHRQKLHGLTIAPDRLQQIRQERKPDSRYASAGQIAFELRAAEAIFQRNGIPYLDATECSVEELASRILQRTGLERRANV